MHADRKPHIRPGVRDGRRLLQLRPIVRGEDDEGVRQPRGPCPADDLVEVRDELRTGDVAVGVDEIQNSK